MRTLALAGLLAAGVDGLPNPGPEAAAAAPHGCPTWCSSYICGYTAHCDTCSFCAPDHPADPCDSPGSFAYEPGKIAPGLLAVMSNDEDIVKANGCNQCPDDKRAVWIAPGDICTLKDMPTAAFDHCGEPAWAKDYEPSDHVKACLTAAQFDELWRTGHCHDTKTTLPFFGKEGLLFCSDTCDAFCEWAAGAPAG